MALVDGKKCPCSIHNVQIKNYLDKKSPNLGCKIYIFSSTKPGHPLHGKHITIEVMFLDVVVVEK